MAAIGLPQIDVKKATLSGIFFKLFERIGINLIGLAVSIILAILLEPEIVGVAALAETFVLLFSVTATYGFGNSLIQNKNSDETDASTALLASVFASSLLYIIIYFLAPLVENFYDYGKYDFARVIRVLALSLFPTSIKSVVQAIIAKRMKFKFFFYSALITALVSGTVGIGMAFKGFGIWAIVGQFITSETVSMIILTIMLRWIPSFSFSKKSLKWILGFGWKLIVVGIINVLYMQIRSLVIAKRYSSSDLAYYNRGLKFAQIVPENLSEALMAVLFPFFSNYAEEKGMLSSMRRSIKTSVYIVFPLSLGLLSVADNLVLVLLREKWTEAIPYLRIFCIAYLFFTIEQIMDQSIKAQGKSGSLLIINIVKKIIGISFFIATIKKGVLGIALGFLVSMLINYLISIIAAKKVLCYELKKQFEDIYKELFAALLMMGWCCLLGRFLPLPRLPVLLIQVFSGGGLYIGLSIVLKLESFYYLLNLAKEIKKSSGGNKNAD